MCGLFAWWPAADTNNIASRAHHALNALAIRGPDAQSLWMAPHNDVVLAHARLKITGEQGTQPIWNADKTVAILVNGQMYDHAIHRIRLARLGHTFVSDSDSEVLLALYERYGLSALEHVEGEFAFVLWDQTRQHVWAGRDRAGVKPLRYTLWGGHLMLASESKALWAAGVPKSWSNTALAQALSVQYTSPHTTLFADIDQVAPGHTVLFRRHNNQWTKTTQPWWRWFPHAATQLLHPTPQEMSFVLHKHLHQAVARRVSDQWPVAVHLSGGCDSTSIAIHAALAHARNMHTYCVQFENVSSMVQHNEAHAACTTARRLGVGFTSVPVTRQELAAHWNIACRHSEQFFINGHGVAKHLLSHHIHEDGYRVSLSGEGADEALLGYAFLRAQSPAHDLRHIMRANPVSVGVMLPDVDRLDVSAIIQRWGNNPVWLQAKASLGWKLHGLLADEWTRTHAPLALHNWAQDIAIQPDAHPIHQAAASWAMCALGGYILPALADAPESAHHIQGRIPFLDGDLLNAVMQWHPDVLCAADESKAPLRDFLRAHNMHHVANRPKHPFQAPPLLSDPTLRQHWRSTWDDRSAWDNTPVDTHKLAAWMNTWDDSTSEEQQRWEPVVSTLLSLQHINAMLKEPPATPL